MSAHRRSFARDTAATVGRVVTAIIAAGVLTACAALAPPTAGSTAGPESGEVSARVPLAALDALADPRSFVGPSTAVLTGDAIEPVDDSPAQVLPATVVSDDVAGPREVTVTDTSRVVAMDLSGSLAATVWGLGFGDTLVGRDVSTVFPGTEDLPLVTSGGHTVSSEAVIALRPTLVLTDGTIGPRDVVEQLRDVGIQVVVLEGEASFEGAADQARRVAAVFGAAEAGEALAERIAVEVADVRADIERIAPSAADERLRMVFLYLRGASGVYYLFGDESGADRLIDALGGVDVAGELGWTGMRPLTDEAMVAADPDLILVMTSGLESVGGVDGLLSAKPAVALTRAGENRRFVDMADGQILSFGPRSAAVLDALARAVYAPDS